MWWFELIDERPPVRFGTATPSIAAITASGSVVPAASTAFTHMLKPM